MKPHTKFSILLTLLLPCYLASANERDVATLKSVYGITSEEAERLKRSPEPLPHEISTSDLAKKFGISEEKAEAFKAFALENAALLIPAEEFKDYIPGSTLCEILSTPQQQEAAVDDALSIATEYRDDLVMVALSASYAYQATTNGTDSIGVLEHEASELSSLYMAEHAPDSFIWGQSLACKTLKPTKKYRILQPEQWLEKPQAPFVDKAGRTSAPLSPEAPSNASLPPSALSEEDYFRGAPEDARERFQGQQKFLVNQGPFDRRNLQLHANLCEQLKTRGDRTKVSAGLVAAQYQPVLANVVARLKYPDGKSFQIPLDNPDGQSLIMTQAAACGWFSEDSER